MASKPINSTELGFHESEISEPPPLRIIKRSKTVSGSSAPGDSLCWRQGGSSGSSLYSKGSPPLSTDRPLTVHKLRKGRASILGSSMGSSRDSGCQPSVFDTPRKLDLREDEDLTPKALLSNRLSSAVTSLKAEDRVGNKSQHDGYYSLRGRHNVGSLHSQNLLQQSAKARPSDNASPTIPERRFSKSKNFILRAMGGPSEICHPIPRSNSAMSRNTLVRRISRRRETSVGSYCSSYECSILSENSSSFEPPNIDLNETYDATFESSQSQPPSSSSSNSTVDTPPRDFLVLYPHIMVTPEISSLDAGLSILWVAIQITGVLQIAGPSRSPGVNKFPTGFTSSDSYDLASYGKLHSMRIDLHPGQGCTVLEIIGNLHESKTIRAGETELILAKVRVAKLTPPPESRGNSTEGMIADLQNHLGDTISAYLTVRLTYKHSAFPNHKPLEPLDGMKLRLSRIETEATATIKRRNPESAWSPRISHFMINPLELDPVIRLVDNHFSPERAGEVRRRLLHDRSSISNARKNSYWAEGNDDVSAGTNFQNDQMDFGTSYAFDTPLQNAKSRRSLRKTVLSQKSPFSSSQSPEDGSQTHLDEIDPARKIWSEMRLTSRGGRNRHSRASLGTNHYFPMEDEGNPTAMTMNENSAARTPHLNTKRNPVPIGDIANERERIMQIALRNKRSVGAETLRSIAPSVSGGRGDGRSKGGSAIGLGLGAGRAWGWSAPWW